MSELPAVQVSNLVKDFRGSSSKEPSSGRAARENGESSPSTATEKREPARGTVRAVDHVTFEIASGEIYGLIGPNGSGKSTTMKALLGLVSPTSGTCSIFGRDSNKVDSRRDVGFLPENPYFYKHLSGEETIRFYGRLCGMKGAALRERTRELLDLVGLQDAGKRRLGGYSKGMLQRIGLAQALVQDPRLLILDEPTAGVDPIGSRQIRDLILKLKERGFTVFLCSHLLEQVQEVCDRVGIIHRGSLVKEGRLEDLISIEDQTEIILRNATPDLLDRVHGLARDEAGVEVVRTGHPRTTLERLFLRETVQRDSGNSPGEQKNPSTEQSP
ncbi:MAG: ABC transporter ATP-binding protein [Verrucomicrobiaceae bacterium]|nr:ABC transporter ATP-binding protein [Verrucomicrobiaceae bacterium]